MKLKKDEGSNTEECPVSVPILQSLSTTLLYKQHQAHGKSI